MTRQYGGIDRFRIAAALLIVAIHTGPLTSINETADFLLTGVLARVGVPFFFMVTGFFLVPRLLDERPGALARVVKKTGLLYLAATLLYLPLEIYKGTFAQPGWLLTVGKNILFNGTFYHLWYLPAVMLGVCIAAGLLKKLGLSGALAAALGLYVLGLLGDSYFGLTSMIPGLRTVYGWMFQLFDYTRNGLFFAPLFLLLGGSLSGRRPERRGAAVGTAAALAVMVGEGLLLRALEWPRHDSMYLLLPVVMYFLFSLLLTVECPGSRELGSAAMMIYIIHPLCIVLVRGAAKVTKLTALFVDNSVVHYLAVCLLSGGIAVGWVLFTRRLGGGFPLPALRPEKQALRRPERLAEPDPCDRAWLEIDLRALEDNVQALRSKLEPGCELMAVVKANGYGHGDKKLALALSDMGVNAFGVAALSEGIALRKAGLEGSILILGYTPPEAAPALLDWDLIQTVVDEAHAQALEQTGLPLRVHWKIDTGMHRLGLSWERAAEVMADCPTLVTGGVFTHLCVSDELGEESQQFTALQIRRFQTAVEQMRQAGLEPGILHAQASYGILNYTGLGCQWVRAGIALYGVLSSYGDVTRSQLALYPVLSLRARVASVRTVEEGDTAGYGRAFGARRRTRIATVTLGYADGWPRALSGKGAALIHGVRVPVVGRICMDQLLLDVTDVPETAQGDVATFLGRDGELEITAEEVAAQAGTITNELLSRLGPRLERVFLD